MASPNARAALLASETYSRLPASVRPSWIDYIEALGEECVIPKDGEVFEDEKHCLRRLNAWGMREGCAYVTRTSRAKHTTPSWDFACIFHDKEPQNNWELEDRVVRERVGKQGEVVSKRQRDTVNRRLGCPVQYRLSHRQIQRGGPEREFTGRWKESTHQGHAVPVNPYSLPPQRQNLAVIQQLKGIAQNYRFASLPYSQAAKLLREDSLGVRLKAKEYYNLKRLQPLDQSDPDSALTLLKALEDEGFHYRTLLKEEFDELNPNKIVSQKLIQIIFWYSDASYLMRRFCADHLLIIDATFNTNRHRMPLITSIGITNEGHPLPIAFSYCPGETADSYTFFLKTVREDILGEGVADLAVVLADMSSGIVSAVRSHQALSEGQKLQFCSWHAAEALIARFRKGAYTEVEKQTLKTLSWAYIQSPSVTDLEVNRQALLECLHPLEKEYINSTWRPKEQQVIYCYTRLLRNLGCSATQRLESFHNIIHQVTHGQLSLHKSAIGLAMRLKEIYIQRAEDEDNAWISKPTGLNLKVFKDLQGQVSLLAIRLIEREYLEFVKEEPEFNPTCECQNRLCYSLPCRHQLIPLRRGDITAIPLGLVHPRWWLNGPPAPPTWAPSWGGKPLILSPKRTEVYSDLAEILAERETLTGEAQARFDRQITSIKANMQRIAQGHRDLESLPLGNPDVIKKKTWSRPVLKTKPTRDARVLTTNEALDKEERTMQIQASRIVRDAEILQQREIGDPTATPPRPPTPEARPPPQAPTPRATTPEPSPEPIPSPTVFDEPPPSTAPPTLRREQRKRARAQSGFYKALQGGDSQEVRAKRAYR
jgi:hypothetical protein